MATATTAVSVAPVTAGGAAVGSGYMNVSLYVGDLEENVVEGQLYDLFGQVGTVLSIRVCRDQNKRSSLGYAYVNYSNYQDGIFLFSFFQWKKMIVFLFFVIYFILD